MATRDMATRDMATGDVAICERAAAPPGASTERSGSRRRARDRHGRRARPWLGALLAAVLVLGVAAGALALGAPPAAAHGLRVDGCTGVPDRGRSFDFHASCDAHDRCYGAKPYGSGAAGRARCDRAFHASMLRRCAWNGSSLARRACRAVAHTYYVGVRALGYPSWRTGLPAPIG